MSEKLALEDKDVPQMKNLDFIMDIPLQLTVELGRTKLLALVYSGQIASVTVGRRRFVLPDALRAFVGALQEARENRDRRRNQQRKRYFAQQSLFSEKA